MVFNLLCTSIDFVFDFGDIGNEIIFMGQTFEIVSKDGQTGIKCLMCGLTSYNPTDIQEKFCGNCDDYHEFPFLNEQKNIDYLKQNELWKQKHLEKFTLNSKPNLRSLKRKEILHNLQKKQIS